MPGGSTRSLKQPKLGAPARWTLHAYLCAAFWLHADRAPSCSAQACLLITKLSECRVAAPSAQLAAVRVGLQLQKGGFGVLQTSVEAVVGDTALHITPGAVALAQAIRQASAAQLVVMLPVSAGEQAGAVVILICCRLLSVAVQHKRLASDWGCPTSLEEIGGLCQGGRCA